MVQRVYATRLMGISDAERRRLEIAEDERLVRVHARRIAEKYGVEVDKVVRRAREIGERVGRWGLDAELRRIAQAYGVEEEQVRARYEAALQDVGL
ncbi:MAG: hypothetical protein ACREMY_29855 [bacterium]